MSDYHRLPRMFWGEIIYATPGSGKTYVANKYRDVIDADDLIVKAIEEEAPHFNFHNYDDPRNKISQYFQYIQFNHKKRLRIYDIAYQLMKMHCAQYDVVLLGTRDLMYRADRVFIQKDDDIVRNGFNQDSEMIELDKHNFDNIHYIDNYLEGSLQKVCAGRL